MKLQAFEEVSVRCAIPLLSAHFAQWSYHVAFPELATIPLYTLKRYHEKSTVEPVKRKVKQLIEQVTIGGPDFSYVCFPSDRKDRLKVQKTEYSKKKSKGKQ